MRRSHPAGRRRVIRRILMSKPHRLSLAKTSQDVEKAFASAKKALELVGLKIALKKPDYDKIWGVMTRDRKPAEFKLDGDGLKVVVTVEYGGKKDVLGVFDIREREILKDMVEAGFKEKSDLDAWDKAHGLAGKDPKAEANAKRKAEEKRKQLAQVDEGLAKVSAAIAELNKKRAANAAKTEPYRKLLGNNDLKLTQIRSVKAIWDDFKAFCASEHSDESIKFLEAVGAAKALDRGAATKIYNQYLKDGSPDQINISAEHLRSFEAELKDARKNAFAIGEIVDAIETLLASDTAKRFLKRPQVEIEMSDRALKELKGKEDLLNAHRKKVAA
jgi:hypothetical protein